MADGATDDILSYLGAFAEPARRREAARGLARQLGGEDILVFAPDPEIGVLLPAPGMPQTLEHAAEWRKFLGRCEREGSHTATLPRPDGKAVPAHGRTAPDRTVVVLLGGAVADPGLDALERVAPLLGALFRSERSAHASAVRSRTADEAVEHARQLSSSLRDSHARLESANAELDAAKRASAERAEHAEKLSEELHAQTSQLQEQAAELEMLNDALTASEAQLRSIIDSALDAIITIGPDSVITEWNRPAEKIFGWTSDDAVGQSLTQMIIPEQYRESHLKGMRHLLRTGEGPILNKRIEITALHRDGREFPVELTVAPSGHRQTPQFSAFIRDISQEKRQEARRGAEEAVTRALAESHTLEGAAVPVLEAMGTALGWKVGAFWSEDEKESHLNCVGVWQAEDIRAEEFADATCNRTFSPGEGLPGRVWERREPVWISDVTKDGNFPRGPSASREGLHAAFAFPILAGDQVLGVVEFFGRDIALPDDDLLATVGAIGNDIGQSIRRIRAEEGRNRLLTEMERVNDHLERLNAELVERSEEAEQAQAAADAANRAKSEFLATMSHELRTPINAIIGYAQLMEEGISGPVTDTQRTQLDRICSSSRHLQVLVTDILDLAKIEAGRLEIETHPGELEEVIESALALIQPQAADQSITLENLSAGRSLPYVGDADRVRQILVNLLSNAVKFTEGAGRVTVQAGQVEEPDTDARVRGSGPWTYAAVEDEGVGITERDIRRVFRPFEQGESGTTRSRGGTGLGLTISRQLARLMGGDLSAQSTRGKGSRMTLWLPATRPEPGAVDDSLLVTPGGGSER